MAELPEPERLIELHPAALSHYEKLVTELKTVFQDGITSETEDAAEKIRNLISHIVVNATDEGLNIELHGRLAKILGPTDLFPNMRIAVSGGLMVAREGVEPPTPGL